jgi:AcrR family transcriptional regulator
MTRKEREKELRRKAILEAAWRVFARDGYFNATMSLIAGEAEFGMGTIYQFFPNKQTLFSEVILGGVESFMEGLRIALEKKSAWKDKLRAFIEFKLGWVEKQPELQRLIMEAFHAPVPDVTPQLIDHFKKFRTENIDILKQILSEAKNENSGIDIELISLLITGTLNAIANDWLIGVLGRVPTEFVPGLVGIVTGGVHV